MEKGSFEDVLRRKMNQQTEASAPRSSVNTSTDPAHLAYLFSLLNVTELSQSKNPFVAKAKPTPPRPAHQLSQEQRDAVRWFFDMGEDLDPAFTREELKTAFRKLALKHHPDQRQDGASHQFMRLMAMYKCLTGCF